MKLVNNIFAALLSLNLLLQVEPGEKARVKS